MKITIDIPDEEQAQKASEIFAALITSGGLWGVKGGQTLIHFDGDGIFMGVQLSYWPFRRRKNINNDSHTPR